MRFFWAGVLLIAGVALAGQQSSEAVVHEITDESPHMIAAYKEQSDLRDVVTSLKDLKTCLCKLISVQKKQIELELARRKDAEKHSKPEMLLGKVKAAKEIPPTNNIVEITPTESAPQPEKEAEVINSEERSKRASFFKEISPQEALLLAQNNYTTDSYEQTEAEFIADIASEQNAEKIELHDEKSDRKSRDTEANAADQDGEGTTPAADSAQTSSEYLSSSEMLTSSFNKMEKDKKMITNSLPRHQSLEFPAEETLYSSYNQKPIDYTLNMPQQTYYFVPGPPGSPGRIVPAPMGTYDGMEDDHDQFPTESLGSQYAPSDMEMMDHEAEGGPTVHYLPMEGEEVEPPKETKKKRKKTKKEKKIVEEEVTESEVGTTTDATVEK